MGPGLDRRSLLLGALGGVITGAAAGIAVGRVGRSSSSAGNAFVEIAEIEKPSYAQQGEDLIVANIFQFLQIATPSYIDIGAHEPIVNNNTYLFYKHGSRGVLVEPNPALTPRLRKLRPGDKVLEIGIGAHADDEEADYYIIEGDGQGNTFSPETARRLQAELGEKIVKQVIKRKLVNVNKVLAENFPPGGPDLFSTDTEGYDLTILQSFDFARFRPAVFCVESLAGVQVEERIVALMKAHDYQVRGGTFVNTIFVDGRRVRALEARGDAG